MTDGLFTADDLAVLSELVIDAWRSGVDRDWSVPAGTLEWSCWRTADHTVDCVFSYAFFLASRRRDAYLAFEELHAFANAPPGELVDGLRAATTMLWAVIVTAAPDAEAIISMTPEPVTGTPADFAARGAHEMILHAHDVCTGLAIPFDPPRDLCARLLEHTATWPRMSATPVGSDPWAQLLRRSGRASF